MNEIIKIITFNSKCVGKDSKDNDENDDGNREEGNK